MYDLVLGLQMMGLLPWIVGFFIACGAIALYYGFLNKT